MACSGPLQPVTVRLFYLDNELKSTADKLRDFFMQLPTGARTNSLYNKKIQLPDIKVLPFNVLVELMNHDIESASSLRYSDIVVILGHSNVFNFGSLDITDILESLLHPKPPSLVAFLGCCGGNGRHGPLAMLSQLPEWQDTVFSFYQRRIYVDELCHTSPVLAIQYYVHLVRANDIEKTKVNIKQAFTDANKDPSFNFKLDIAFKLNCEKEQTAQKLLKMVKNFNIQVSTEEIPLSCWQLALYHTFTVEPEGESAICKFISGIKRELESFVTQVVQKEDKEMLITKIDEKCKAELERRKLYDIIELACEIQLLQVTDETLKLLRKNKWIEIDHLQFFVAMLHGYWGKNDYNDLRGYATYHLMKVMEPIATVATPDEHKIHTYQLCCVGYCLFAPEIYILFDEHYPHNQSLGFSLWGNDIPFQYAVKSCLDIPYPDRYINIPTGQVDQYKKRYFIAKGSLESVITDKGYRCIENHQISRKPYFIPLDALPTIEDELPWVDVFGFRQMDPRFVYLYNGEIDDYKMHSFRKGECVLCKKNKDKIPCEYKYLREDLKSALNALKNCLFPSDNDRCLKHYYNYYCIKGFENRDTHCNRDSGRMKCFIKPTTRNNLTFNYLEMRVVHDFKKLQELEDSKKSKLMKNHEEIWPMVSRCRFVFQYADLQGGEKKRGRLFFTDSHYGQDAICKKLISEKLGIDVDKMDYFEVMSKCKKRDIYDLQEKSLQKIVVKTLQETLTDSFQQEKLQELLVKNKPENLQIVHKTLKKLVEDLEKQLNFQKLLKLLSNWLVLSDWLGGHLEKLFVEKLEVNEIRQLLVTDWSEIVTKMLHDSTEIFKSDLKVRGVYPFVDIGKLTITRNDPPTLQWYY